MESPTRLNNCLNQVHSRCILTPYPLFVRDSLAECLEKSPFQRPTDTIVTHILFRTNGTVL